jgi:prepilin-type N-terminal cleavage/methylation domain-containing protein
MLTSRTLLEMLNDRGLSLTELVVTVALIGLVAVITIPLLVGYLSSATVNWAALEVQGGLNRAKLLAVNTRQSICVQVAPTSYQLRQGTCAGAAWTGPGSTAAGNFRLASNVILTANQSPIFTQFGAASQTGTLTVAAGGRTLTVSVQASGRVTIP